MYIIYGNVLPNCGYNNKFSLVPRHSLICLQEIRTFCKSEVEARIVSQSHYHDVIMDGSIL